jgi:hypothetical protein
VVAYARTPTCDRLLSLDRFKSHVESFCCDCCPIGFTSAAARAAQP